MSKELDTAVEAAKAAGEILMQNFRTGVLAELKSAKELVTQIDLQSEKKIVSILQKEFPNYSVLAEEKASKERESDYTWIIDPLDGTHNYFFGLPIFAVSIALGKNDVIQCGAILLPTLDELYAAEKGKGAFMNGKRLTVSKRSMKEAAINLCGDVWADNRRIDRLKQIAAKAFTSRAFGSSCFTLASIASGNLDAVIEFIDKPWDFAAGWLLIEEAGGKFTDFEGKKMSLEKRAYLASNGLFHEKLAEIMGGP